MFHDLVTMKGKLSGHKILFGLSMGGEKDENKSTIVTNPGREYLNRPDIPKYSFNIPAGSGRRKMQAKAVARFA
ncbi:MAG: hypothetical protein MJ202_06900 [Lentisphaeria bacterium]|nr:hypothetical protein [Lentisphaeria bacterium]